MTRLTLKQKILFTLGLIAAILLIILGFIIYPAANKIYRLQKEIRKIETELDKRFANSQKQKLTLKKLDEVSKEINLMGQTMLLAGSELGLITDLEYLADKHRITQNITVSLKEIEPADRQADLTNYYLFTFSNEGKFSDQAQYLAELENLPFYLITDNVKWEKRKEDKNGKSTIILSFNSIIYVDPISTKK